MSTEYTDENGILTICVLSSQSVVSDTTLQEMLGKLLEGEKEEFYVNAKRSRRKSKTVYKYSVTDPAVKMFQQTSRRGGDCLTVTSPRGSLRSAGVPCGKARRPLCHRLGRTFSLAEVERRVMERADKHVSSCSDDGAY